MKISCEPQVIIRCIRDLEIFKNKKSKVFFTSYLLFKAYFQSLHVIMVYARRDTCIVVTGNSERNASPPET